MSTARAAPAATGDAYMDRRVDIAMPLFRALLAADVDLPDKTRDGRLLVVFVYAEDRKRAEGLASELLRLDATGASANVRGLPIEAELTVDASLAAYQTGPPAAVFLVEPLATSELEKLVRFGIARHRIVYTPFEGEVERGVTAGLSIEAQVRVLVNLRTLEASGITLKPFFMRAAVKGYR